MVKIAPSILSADFGNLREEIIRLDKAGADMIHLDVMDGNFVPNLTFGPMIVKQIRPFTKLTFDTHLMVCNPDEMIPWFAKAGSDVITVHYEASRDVKASIKKIKDLGLKAGVSIKPATNSEVLKPFLDYIDVIMVMTVEPGFGGQCFMHDQLEKISIIKEMIKGKNIEIEVDGGIDAETAPKAIKAGADILVAGTSVFKGGDYAANIKALR